MRQQHMNQLRASYPSNITSSPARRSSALGFDSSAAVAAAVMNSRSAAFGKRSQSFIDRGAAGLSHRAGVNAPASIMSSNLSDWSSPNGKLDWGFHGEDVNKLRKSASFGLRNGSATGMKQHSMMTQNNMDEPDVSWVHSLVKDVPPTANSGIFAPEQKLGGIHDTTPSWIDQLYIEQEQMVA